jgi:hypothetical protein
LGNHGAPFGLKREIHFPAIWLNLSTANVPSKRQKKIAFFPPVDDKNGQKTQNFLCVTLAHRSRQMRNGFSEKRR